MYKRSTVARAIIPDDYWDDLCPPVLTSQGSDVNELKDWLEKTVPKDEEHEYLLYTDGSGCRFGWGAYASLAQKVTEDGLESDPLLCRVGANYNHDQCVERNEMTAFIEGLQSILCHQLSWQKKDGGAEEVRQVSAWKNMFTGTNRIRVKWYTDRFNLACGLLFKEDGEPLNDRSTVQDLWGRFNFGFARYFCVSPCPLPRNTVTAQAATDKLCGIARKALKEQQSQLATAALSGNYNIESWIKPKSQKNPLRVRPVNDDSE